jgi:hypothetical protein
MSDKTDLEESINWKGYCLVSLWAAGIAIFYIIVGYWGVRQLQEYKAETMTLRQIRLEAGTTEPGAPAPEIKTPRGAQAVDVLVGIYINRIVEISFKEGNWIADFDIWFRWTGDGVSPGENFQVVNGQIDLRQKKQRYVKGLEQYELYRVRARIAMSVQSSRFPFSDEPLNIQIEDRTNWAATLCYVADKPGSGIYRSRTSQSVKIEEWLVTVKLHDYESSRGDPRFTAGDTSVYSRFFFAMLVFPPSVELFVMMFEGLFASVAIALLVFFIKPIHVDPRFGLGIGAFFAAVGNVIYVGTVLPQPDRVTVAGMVNGIGLLTISLTLVQSTISLYVLDTLGREKLRLFFDKISFVVFLTGYVVVNLLLVLAAKP